MEVVSQVGNESNRPFNQRLIPIDHSNLHREDRLGVRTIQSSVTVKPNSLYSNVANAFEPSLIELAKSCLEFELDLT